MADQTTPKDRRQADRDAELRRQADVRKAVKNAELPKGGDLHDEALSSREGEVETIVRTGQEP